MLKDISKYNFYGRSHFVRLRGKYTAQCTHCAMYPWPDSLPVPSQPTTNLQGLINETTLNFGLIQTAPHL